MKIFFNFWRKEKREIFLFEKVALLSFSDFERTSSSVLLQVCLRQAYQNIVVHVETNIFTDRFFWKVYHFFGISGIPAKSFQSFDENVLTGWPQLHSTCTEAQFQEKYFSFEKFINSLVIFLESQRQIWGCFGENFLVWLLKLHSPLLNKHF